MDAVRVSLARYLRSPDSLRSLLEDCGGLERLAAIRPSDRVMIKPNLVGADDPFPVAPFGVYTTTRIVEDLVILLKQAGAARIAVAEGAVRFGPADPGTPKLFARLGYDWLARRYGIELVDLNQGPWQEHEVLGETLGFARPALEADRLINLPVLKTHNQTRISAGLKNLKGCLAERSRKHCHGKGLRARVPLDELLSGLVEVLRPALTVIDGIYALERGPFALGRARRLDALVASLDPLAADVAAARLLGQPPDQVAHLRLFAERTGRSLDLPSGTLSGEPIEALRSELAWDFDWHTDPRAAGPPAWRQQGLVGLSVPKYDASLCTGCSAIYNPLVLLLGSVGPGRDFGGLQVLTGKRMRPTVGFARTLLVGDCMIGRNRTAPEAGQVIELAGCPPSLDDLIASLRVLGLQPDPQVVMSFRQHQARRYAGDPAFDPEHFYPTPELRPDWLRPGERGIAP